MTKVMGEEFSTGSGPRVAGATLGMTLNYAAALT